MTPYSDPDCMLCQPDKADTFYRRARVWQDDLWRLSVLLQGAVPGFAHLEPKRHIPHISDLSGPESRTLGDVLARMTDALRRATQAEKTYVYVFGDHVPHLHFNLAPHRMGDALQGGPGLLHAHAVEAAEADHRRAADAAAAVLNVPS